MIWVEEENDDYNGFRERAKNILRGWGGFSRNTKDVIFFYMCFKWLIVLCAIVIHEGWSMDGGLREPSVVAVGSATGHC